MTARRVVGAVGVVGLLLAGCSDAGPTAGEDAAPATTDLDARPDVRLPAGDPPDDLVVEDLVVGDGAAPTAGDLVATQYVGVGFGSGAAFDASWDRGEPLRFRVGAGQVIPGWDLAVLGDPDRGVEPMRVGGRRQVVVPPSLGYGERLLPGLEDPDDTTLVFVIDLVAVG